MKLSDADECGRPHSWDCELVRHAEEELRRAGMFDKDADYGPEFAESLLSVIRKFAEWGHSGSSAAIAVEILQRLLRYEVLTPLTHELDEYLDRSEESGQPMWQNKRKSTVFSTEPGKTWYDLDEPGRPVHNVGENNAKTYS